MLSVMDDVILGGSVMLPGNCSMVTEQEWTLMQQSQLWFYSVMKAVSNQMQGSHALPYLHPNMV